MNVHREPVRAGLEHPVRDSQATFRAVLDAMASPGTIRKITVHLDPPHSLDVATTATCLTLLDYETRLWIPASDESPALKSFFRFHCGCQIVESPQDAEFVLIPDARGIPGLSAFNDGSVEEPHRSATLVVRVPSLSQGPAVSLKGPGIAETQWIAPQGLPSRFWEEWQVNHAKFPRGVDLILTSGNTVAALPRTIAVEF
jgi:alpha-D-ribose 1-methylphosphonate 5-triphosphate synthase subunit PhnH